MPLIKITTSVAPSESTCTALLNTLSALLASRLGKPEAYVMTALDPVASMTFGGTAEPAAYVEVKNVGRFSAEQTTKLSGELTARLSKALGVASGRIYIQFEDAEGYLWGHDGETFG